MMTMPKKTKYIVIFISLIIFIGMGTIYYQDYKYTHNYEKRKGGE